MKSPAIDIVADFLMPRSIDETFGGSYGPTSVRAFVEETQILGDRTPDQWQQDAFGQVDARLKALGVRK